MLARWAREAVVMFRGPVDVDVGGGGALIVVLVMFRRKWKGFLNAAGDEGGGVVCMS